MAIITAMSSRLVPISASNGLCWREIIDRSAWSITTLVSTLRVQSNRKRSITWRVQGEAS
jgi:hypothetical protein